MASNYAGKAIVMGEVGGPEELVRAYLADYMRDEFLFGFQGDPALAPEVVAGLLPEVGGVALALELVVEAFEEVCKPSGPGLQENILHIRDNDRRRLR